MFIIIIFVFVIIILIAIIKNNKPKIWVPGPFCGVWKNQNYRVILTENSIEVWQRESGYIDIFGSKYYQDYKGGYSIKAIKNNMIQNTLFFGIGDRINFNTILLSITQYPFLNSIEDLKYGIEIARERLNRE